MSKELVVSSNRHETRVAILEDDQLVEIHFQRQQEYSLAGSIHKGRVTRVLPGMQSAFVDIGLDRDAFLYVSDFFEDNDEYEQVVGAVEEQVLRLEKGGAPRGTAPEPEVPVREAAAIVNAPQAIVELATPAMTPLGERPALLPAGQSGQDRDGRDRRGGRRPRRRRGRGRGFPDSKYASPNAPIQSRPETTEISEIPRREEQEEDLPVLPGESISKYRGVEPEPEFEADTREPDEVVQQESELSVEPLPEPEPISEPEPLPEPVREPEPEPERIRWEPEVIAIREPEVIATREPEPEPFLEIAEEPISFAAESVAESAIESEKRKRKTRKSRPKRWPGNQVRWAPKKRRSW